MSGFQVSDTMPKLGYVTDLREQWLVRTDGALANRLQDREISSHLSENKCRNQQIREDFPVAMNEQRDLEHEAFIRDLARRRQAEIDAEIAREMAEINLRRRRSQQSADLVQQSCSSTAALPPPLEPVGVSLTSNDLDPNELGLTYVELEEIKRRMEQEERDLRLARELSHESQGQDALLADMKCAVEAQDGELARLLQEREYKKLQKAKEKAKQKLLLKKQQRLAAQQQRQLPPQPALCDAYSNPRDVIHQNGLRLSKSVDSDLNYAEPFEKEHIQSKASALQEKAASKQYQSSVVEAHSSNTCLTNSVSSEPDTHNGQALMYFGSLTTHRQPPPPPMFGKKPRFPDPVSIRPASQYPADSPSLPQRSSEPGHGYYESNNVYSSTFPLDSGQTSPCSVDRTDPSKRLSVTSEITAEGLVKRKNKQTENQKKRKGCKIQ